MVTGEDEMVRKIPEATESREERFTSLQPTYEDSVPDDDEMDWDNDRTS